MTTKDFTEFHTLVEQFQGEMPLKEICTQESVDYRSYISWRSKRPFVRRTIFQGLFKALIRDRIY